MAERRRGRLFLIGFALCTAPVLTLVSLEALVPAFYAVVRQGLPSVIAGCLVFPPLFSLPLVTAYLVNSRELLLVRRLATSSGRRTPVRELLPLALLAGLAASLPIVWLMQADVAGVLLWAAPLLVVLAFWLGQRARKQTNVAARSRDRVLGEFVRRLAGAPPAGPDARHQLNRQFEQALSCSKVTTRVWAQAASDETTEAWRDLFDRFDGVTQLRRAHDEAQYELLCELVPGAENSPECLVAPALDPFGHLVGGVVAQERLRSGAVRWQRL